MLASMIGLIASQGQVLPEKGRRSRIQTTTINKVIQSLDCFTSQAITSAQLGLRVAFLSTQVLRGLGLELGLSQSMCVKMIPTSTQVT